MWRSVRKSEGESKPDAHFDNVVATLVNPQLIHTAHPTSSSLFNLPPNNIPDNDATPPLIEFHTATDICFEIYLQIISNTDDIVITHSCFTTCARYIASRSEVEVS